MTNFIGQFYFKREEDGKLKGEFSNYMLESPSEENAIPKENTFLPTFEGEYNSSWKEKEGNCSADLVIKKTNKFYSLIWTKHDSKESKFYGEGFLVDEILIGHYRNFEI